MAIKGPTKKAVHQRDKYKCRKCGAFSDLQLHHVVPQRLGGADDSYNLVCLCHECHTLWHQIEASLGIGFMKKRVIDTFYEWIKYDKILLGNNRIRKKFKVAERVSKPKKEKSRQSCSC